MGGCREEQEGRRWADGLGRSVRCCLVLLMMRRQASSRMSDAVHLEVLLNESTATATDRMRRVRGVWWSEGRRRRRTQPHSSGEDKV